MGRAVTDMIHGLKNIMIDDFLNIFGNPIICSSLFKAVSNKHIKVDKLDNGIVLDNVLLDKNNNGYGLVGYSIIFLPIEYVSLVYLKKMSHDPSSTLLDNKILSKALEPINTQKRHYMFVYKKKCLIAVRTVAPSDFIKRFDVISNHLECDCGTSVNILNDYKNVFYSKELNIIYPKCENCT